jgi:hypothetical protein
MEGVGELTDQEMILRIIEATKLKELAGQRRRRRAILSLVDYFGCLSNRHTIVDYFGCLVNSG